MLEYGFNCCHIYKDINIDPIKNVKVVGGENNEVMAMYDKEFSYSCRKRHKKSRLYIKSA